MSKPVLVTTKHRGVFFGFEKSRDGNSIILEKARCAIKWSTTGGFLELAKIGPNLNSNIGTEAEEIELWDVTSVSAVSSEAVAKWQSA